jgi:type VI secretion system protein ImpF
MAVAAACGLEGLRMHGFSRGLFDRLDDDDDQALATRRRSRQQALDACQQSISRDLESLLNTRSALLASELAPYPAVSDSIVNYGLIDFAAMCMTSDTDQQRICTAVRKAIERHEPRLHKVSVTLQPKKGSINRVDFMITAQLKSVLHQEPLSFNAVFRPSLQQYSVEDAS